LLVLYPFGLDMMLSLKMLGLVARQTQMYEFDQKKNIYPSEFFFSLLALLEYNSHKNPDSSHGLAISKKVY